MDLSRTYTVAVLLVMDYVIIYLETFDTFMYGLQNARQFFCRRRSNSTVLNTSRGITVYPASILQCGILFFFCHMFHPWKSNFHVK